METAIKATIDFDGHAQGTMSYTTSPVHNMQTWLDLALKLQDLGCHTLAIKDMAGLLDPYVGYELVSKLKERIEILFIFIAMQLQECLQQQQSSVLKQD